MSDKTTTTIDTLKALAASLREAKPIESAAELAKAAASIMKGK